MYALADLNYFIGQVKYIHHKALGLKSHFNKMIFEDDDSIQAIIKSKYYPDVFPNYEIEKGYMFTSLEKYIEDSSLYVLELKLNEKIKLKTTEIPKPKAIEGLKSMNKIKELRKIIRDKEKEIFELYKETNIDRAYYLPKYALLIDLYVNNKVETSRIVSKLLMVEEKENMDNWKNKLSQVFNNNKYKKYTEGFEIEEF